MHFSKSDLYTRIVLLYQAPQWSERKIFTQQEIVLELQQKLMKEKISFNVYSIKDVFQQQK